MMPAAPEPMAGNPARGGGDSRRQANMGLFPGGINPPKCQFITSVLIRLGTSPTGMTALTFMLATSMAVTDLIAALEM